MANANAIGPSTRINGTLETDEDLTVEGRVEGGPVRVRGRLTVAARGIVLAEDAEVREALIVGVFVGTLKAHEIVRLHQDGRVVGEVIAPRVVFVSDKPVPGRETRPSIPPRAPKTDEAPEAPAASAASPAEPAPAGAAPPERSIPPLPNMGHRAMQRKE